MTDEVMHTPGPWTTGPRGVSVYGPDNMRLATLDSRLLSQRSHNARLMAAAPDMLAALRAAELIMRAYVMPEHFDGHAAAALTTVRDAIAKAT